MIEKAVVAIIVGVVGILAIRSLYRTLTGRNKGCGCSADECPNEETCDEKQEDSSSKPMSDI